MFFSKNASVLFVCLFACFYRLKYDVEVAGTMKREYQGPKLKGDFI